MEYSSRKASIRLASNTKGFFSHLTVDNVTLEDGGVYKCDSDLTEEASVQVAISISMTLLTYALLIPDDSR